MYILVVLVTVIVGTNSAYVSGLNGEDVSLQTLLERMELMESRHAKAVDSMESKYAKAIELMQSKHAGEVQKLSLKHEEDVERLTTRVGNCERASFPVADTLSSTVKDEATDSSKVRSDLPRKRGKYAKKSMPRRNLEQDNQIRTPVRRLYEGDNIAFSAYLDHDLNGIGTNQVIVMNQLLLNDGHGYSPNTGVFTVPVDGVYSFSFFLGDRDTNQIFARLTVNSTPEVDAIVETVHGSHDAQGGNTVNLKLSSGDEVMLKHTREFFIDSDHLEGSDVARLSTFSGFLLYPIDNAPTVVGK